MSNVEYDLDVSGGLMDQIQALIAPPTSEDDKDKQKKPVPEHPYFKRPGKGHNHDSCDACGEGGNLICCDQCPSSFHLQCHDPPLEKSDIPRGVWMCHSCKHASQKRPASSPAPQTRTAKRSSSTPAGGTASSASTTSTSSVRSAALKKARPSPMDLLIEAAQALNPKQFELPRSMSVPCVFPGTDKIESPCMRKRSQKLPKDHEKTAGGLVPLPARKCNECGKSCRVAPLIACDYCSLYFHLDCLDPPLTVPPTGRWMCPNHVEHFLDSKLLTSVSATERVALWDKFSMPVDQDAIKLQFIRKVTSKNPPFRVKVKLPPRDRVKVPPMVRDHYERPVQLLPSLRDVLRLNTVLNRRTFEQARLDQIQEDERTERTMTTEQYDNDVEMTEVQEKMEVEAEDEDEEDEEEEAAEEEADASDRNGDVIYVDTENKCSENCKLENGSLQCRGCYELNGGGGGDSDNVLSDSSNNSDDEAADGVARSNSAETTESDVRCHKDNKEAVCEDFVYNGRVKPEYNYYVNGVNCHYDIKKENCAISEDYVDISDVELELKQLDDRLIKLLAFQRIQQLLTQQHHHHHPLSSFLSSATGLESKLRHMPLPSELLTPADIDRISRVFSSPKRKARPKSTVRARAMFCPVVSQHFYNIKTSEVDPASLRHDASFMGLRPTVSSRFPDAVPMKYRVINVGRGSPNEIDLERFGNCNCISPRHAVIFYDDFTRQYELINYSVYGTHVNNVLYSNDLSKERVVQRDAKESKVEAVESRVREIIDKKRKVARPRRQFLEKMAATDYLERVDCCCHGAADEVKSGWEGSALLNHGALLRFGCISFVFSIVECAP